MAEKATHQRIAEEVVSKCKASVRKGLTITPKSSYSIITDEDGWLVRLTPKIAEFSKRRITEDDLEAAGLIDTGKDGMHRKHCLGVAAVPASASEGREVAKVTTPEGAGLEEMTAAVERAAKKPKAAAKAAAS